MDIQLQTPSDNDQVEKLLDLTFGKDRFQKAAYSLRKDVDPIETLSFVIRKRGALIATLRFWPVNIKTTELILLGPIAVLPELQGNGLGIKLMFHGLMEATRQGHERVLLVGDEDYYKKVGFSRDLAENITLIGEVDQNRVLGHELVKGSFKSLKGTLKNCTSKR